MLTQNINSKMKSSVAVELHNLYKLTTVAQQTCTISLCLTSQFFPAHCGLGMASKFSITGGTVEDSFTCPMTFLMFRCEWQA